jgi:hypothetical protein
LVTGRSGRGVDRETAPATVGSASRIDAADLQAEFSGETPAFACQCGWRAEGKAALLLLKKALTPSPVKVRPLIRRAVRSDPDRAA